MSSNRHLARHLVLSCLVASLAACDDDGSSPSSLIHGSYELTSVNEHTLPFLLQEGPTTCPNGAGTQRIEVFAGTMTANETRPDTLRLQSRITCTPSGDGAMTVTSPWSVAYGFEVRGDTVCLQTCTQASIAGGVVTVAMVLDDGRPYTLRWERR